MSDEVRLNFGVCADCGKPSIFMHCCELEGGVWHCPKCWETHPCENEHEAGCATKIVNVGAPRGGPPSEDKN